MLHGPNGDPVPSPWMTWSQCVTLTPANIAQENTYTVEGRQICLGT
jgi:hypothetical protein